MNEFRQLSQGALYTLVVSFSSYAREIQAGKVLLFASQPSIRIVELHKTNYSGVTDGIIEMPYPLVDPLTDPRYRTNTGKEIVMNGIGSEISLYQGLFDYFSNVQSFTYIKDTEGCRTVFRGDEDDA